MNKLVITTAVAGAGLVTLSLAPITARARPVQPVAGPAWSPCTEEGLSGLECATLKAPLDHADLRGPQITLALSRARHTGTTGYQGALLVNPGGPGGTGRDFALRVADHLPAGLRAAYDVVGFDPRGVGDSNPALTCDTGYFKPVRPDYVPRTATLESTWLRRSAVYAAACGQKYGSLLPHMRTVDTVQDMDAIRAALGEKQINFYGASYGTYLGSVYATLFPSRVRRMVLDSSVRPSGVWYDDNLDQDRAFEGNINALFAWIAKYDAVYHLGATQRAVRDFYFATREKLTAAPAGGVVGGDELDDSFLIAGYIDLGSYWPHLASALARYKAGDAAPLINAYNTFGATTDDNGYAVYNAVQCTDIQWPRNWTRWHQDNARLYAEGFRFETWGNAWYNAPCAFWPARAGRPVDVGRTQGLPPVLLFQATDDAATPYAGGVEMNRRLKGSHLVIEDGGRTHGIVQRGNACVDDKFNAFLAAGTLPADRSHCARLPEPVPPSTSAARVLTTDQFPPVLRRP
ncbi:alpha/beta hydrolase [Actinoallomurus purpureus]|uniref:alpha/beta hydrolase n=1 Tax=Actinoallomurus purpureus TaxID=478114 RepID=UPI002092BB79|nr:alpha/beta hydrolase [Actinoallomurus purpureus]MCO6011068.1 alpha/beta hydrolase [Actinoallomurus purpureus]